MKKILLIIALSMTLVLSGCVKSSSDIPDLRTTKEYGPDWLNRNLLKYNPYMFFDKWGQPDVVVDSYSYGWYMEPGYLVIAHFELGRAVGFEFRMEQESSTIDLGDPTEFSDLAELEEYFGAKIKMPENFKVVGCRRYGEKIMEIDINHENDFYELRLARTVEDILGSRYHYDEVVRSDLTVRKYDNGIVCTNFIDKGIQYLFYSDEVDTKTLATTVNEYINFNE
ncbi:MAG: hypothetical protein IKE33_04870 [Erysipelotrichaceae bacterium]|nr:hypothetical protein [Erysipelotrichaceae bacterium]